MATEIDKINQQLEKIEDDLKITMVAFNAIGLTSEERVALINKETALIKDRTSLREQKQVHIAGTSAPSGNPINLSQSLHKVFECVVVVLFPLFCRGHVHPHILS